MFARTLNFPYWHYDEHVVHDFQILLIGPDGHIRSVLTWANRSADLFARSTANRSFTATESVEHE
jgi:6-phosphogluconolactonase/glucosamine-6-phosphate isomerase/deaminase